MIKETAIKGKLRTSGDNTEAADHGAKLVTKDYIENLRTSFLHGSAVTSRASEAEKANKEIRSIVKAIKEHEELRSQLESLLAYKMRANAALRVNSVLTKTFNRYFPSK